MLATLATADSARTVRKKYSVFIYSDVEPHAMYAIYKQTLTLCVLQYLSWVLWPSSMDECGQINRRVLFDRLLAGLFEIPGHESYCPGEARRPDRRGRGQARRWHKGDTGTLVCGKGS